MFSDSPTPHTVRPLIPQSLSEGIPSNKGRHRHLLVSSSRARHLRTEWHLWASLCSRLLCEVWISTSHDLRSLIRGHDPRDHWSLAPLKTPSMLFGGMWHPAHGNQVAMVLEKTSALAFIFCLSFLLYKGKVAVCLKSYSMESATGL